MVPLSSGAPRPAPHTPRAFSSWEAPPSPHPTAALLPLSPHATVAVRVPAPPGLCPTAPHCPGAPHQPLPQPLRGRSPIPVSAPSGNCRTPGTARRRRQRRRRCPRVRSRGGSWWRGWRRGRAVRGGAGGSAPLRSAPLRSAARAAGRPHPRPRPQRPLRATAPRAHPRGLGQSALPAPPAVAAAGQSRRAARRRPMGSARCSSHLRAACGRGRGGRRGRRRGGAGPAASLGSLGQRGAGPAPQRVPASGQ